MGSSATRTGRGGGRRPSFDIRERLVGSERVKWDALNAEADSMFARRKQLTRELNTLRHRAWNRHRHQVSQTPTSRAGTTEAT